MNLKNAVESTRSGYCTDCSSDFDDFLDHPIGDTPSAKNRQNRLSNQHINHSRNDSSAFFRLKGITRSIALIIMVLFTSTTWSYSRYGEALCSSSDYYCIKVKTGETWGNLFPNDETKDIVRRINRMNIRLHAGMIIAVPKNIDRLTIYDVSPFPRYIESEGEKTIYISQQKLAWGAYNEEGELVWWGPISSGSGICRGVIGGCTTPTGSYRIIRKQDIDCISTAFPRRADGDDGGAQMPFCMHFFRGYALHGSEEVPGYRASHGCIRMFTEDARWLNEEFVDLPGGGQKGTRIIIDAVHDIYP